MVNIILFLDGEQEKSYVVVEPNGGGRVHALPYPNGIYSLDCKEGHMKKNRLFACLFASGSKEHHISR